MSILINDTQSGNDVSFKAFYKQYYVLVRKRAFYLLKNREDAEDVTQATFIERYREQEVA